MPIITEANVIQNIEPDTVLPEAAPPKTKADTESPGLGETFGAAFERENSIGSFISGGSKDKRALDAEYDPFEKIKGTKYELQPDAFIYADSDEELEAVKTRVDREQDNLRIIEQSGWTGIAASMAAGLLDPTVLIPGGTFIKAGKAVQRIGRGAAMGATAASGSIAAQEALLQASQVTRPMEESGAAIIAGGVFGGIMGGALGALVKGQKAAGELITDKVYKGEDLKIRIDDETGKVSVDPRSVGAAQTDHVRLRNEEGIAHLNETFVRGTSNLTRSPTLRGLGSKYSNVKTITNGLFEHNFVLNKNKIGTATPKAVETFLKEDQGKLIQMNTKLKNLYLKAVGREGQTFGEVRATIGGVRGKHMSYNQFSEEMAKAMRRGDVHENPAIDAAAKLVRSDMDKVTKRMQELGLLPAELEVKTAKSYLSRRYNIDKIARNRAQFEEKIRQYFARSTDLDEDDIALRASSVTDNILGLGDEQLQLASLTRDAIKTKSSTFTKERVLLIDDSEIEDFLVNDGIGISTAYLSRANSLIRFQEFLQRNGYDTVADFKKAIRDEHEILLAQGKVDIQDLRSNMDLVDQQIGIITGDLGGGKASKIDDGLRILRKYQVMRLLGGVAVSSIPDMAMPILRNGIGPTVRDGYATMVRNFKKAKLSRDEWMDFNVGLELEQNEMLRAIVDPDFSLSTSRTATERYADTAMDAFGKMTGMTYWNRFHKRLAAQVSSSRSIRQIIKADAGKELSSVEVERLASLGIGKAMYKRIANQFNKYGQEESGSFITNISKWDDAEAKSLFGGAVLRDVDSTVLTPGRGDIPVLIQKSEIAKTVFQFKSFTAAATNKILLSSLQRRDKNVVTGIMGLTALGAMSYAIKQHLAGKEPSSDIDVLLKEGISRSGVAGLIGDGAFLLVPGLNSSRFAAFNTTQAIVGPTFGQMGDVTDILNRLSDGEVSSSDTKKMTKMVPMQNLFWLRWGLNQVNKEGN